MDERRILFKVEHGYDRNGFYERFHEYRDLLTGLTYDGLTEEEVRKRVEELKAVPLAESINGFEMEKVDFILDEYETRLTMFRAADFAKIERVRSGYDCESVEAKIFAYNKVIASFNGGMNRSLAMNYLEKARQLPLRKAKFHLLWKTGYDRGRIDAFIADLDAHVYDTIR